MKKYILSFLLLILSLTIVTAGLFQGYKIYQANKEKYSYIKVADSTPEINKLPHYLAVKESIYKSQMVKVKQVKTDNDQEALRALENGDADVALVKITSLLYNRTSSLREGPGNTIFAALDQGITYHLVSPENKLLDDIQDVKNKTVITGMQNSLETVILESVLRDAGVNPYESVTLITNMPDEIKIGALKVKTGHYLVVEGNNLIPTLSEGLYNAKTIPAEFPVYVCVTSARFIKEQPDALQRFTNAIYMAQTWLSFHTPQESVKAVGKIPSIDGDLLPEMIKQFYGILPKNPVPKLENINILVNMYQNSREIPMPVKAEDIATEQFANTSVKTVHYIPEDKKPKSGLEKLKFWEK